MADIKVKICGLTCKEDIELINQLNCDMAGFVLFCPKSRRNLDIEKAAKLAQGLKDVKSVAVTVSPTPIQTELIANAGFDIIQIHGELTKDTYAACSLPILRAFNVSNMDKAAHCQKLDKIIGYVFDAAEPGSGKTFDWNSLSEIKTDGKLRILAGGLTPKNVTAAIKAVNPDGVDVSSGVEKTGGGKDAALAEEFVKNARAAKGE